jgi:hypothetical protein
MRFFPNRDYDLHPDTPDVSKRRWHALKYIPALLNDEIKRRDGERT